MTTQPTERPTNVLVPSEHDTARALLRHGLAVLAYRGGKVLRDAPPSFAEFSVGPKTRTPIQILSHVADLMAWFTMLATGQKGWNESPKRPWNEECDRFFENLAQADALLASDTPLQAPAGKLLAGPLADALTHVGQIGLLRRLVDSPVRGENYFAADITTGRVGPDQAPAVREFD